MKACSLKPQGFDAGDLRGHVASNAGRFPDVFRVDWVVVCVVSGIC